MRHMKKRKDSKKNFPKGAPQECLPEPRCGCRRAYYPPPYWR